MNYFLFLSSLFVALVFLLSSFKKSKLEIVHSPFTLPLAGFGLVTLVSTFATNTYPIEHLLGNGGIYLSFALIALLGGTLLAKFNPKKVYLYFGLSGLLALFLLWNRTLIWHILRSVANGSSTLLDFRPVLLSPMASWAVAFATIKNWRYALIGIGPNSYSSAFNLFKPQWFNNLDQWNIQFSSSANFPLTIVVTMGVFALIFWIWLLVALIFQTKKIRRPTLPIHILLLLSFVVGFVISGGIFLIMLQSLLFTFWISSENSRFSTATISFLKPLSKFSALKKHQKRISRVTIVLLILFTLILIGLTKVATYSGYLMYRASQESANNNLIASYETQKKAIKLNPFLDSYHRQYSNTNLILAAALSQKSDLTDENKEQFAKLISQAIREAKIAVKLDPIDPQNWINLAEIYRSQLEVAKDADDWAISSYTEAIRLVPYSPILRLQLGSIFFQMTDYETALLLFEQAIVLKPDYADAYYNAAQALAKIGRIEDAKRAYEKTLVLLEPGSQNYQQVIGELEELEGAE